MIRTHKTTEGRLEVLYKHPKLQVMASALGAKVACPDKKVFCISGNRLLIGMGNGWMDLEFEALSLNRHTRGRVSDATLAFLNDCVASEEVEGNG